MSVLQSRIGYYRERVQQQLQPEFVRAGLSYPSQQIALLVFKNDKRLELWGKDDGAWRHVKNFKILAASGHAGPKLRNHDLQVPEGIYSIVDLNPNSHFHLSMQINYPNFYDLQHAEQDRRMNLGGDIFIHGSDLSIGCIAIGDESIDQLFVLSYLVGIKNVEVIIAPNDLRQQKPIYVKSDPTWVRDLYENIQMALQRFRV
ncbi:MAG: hypothetical protein A3F17_08010 [Gammaproteobacteria bacterium RIFCSPHIGHO2_12_FULL_41_15]|nr:MAG: hypothetical protein A3F17_08010 [Gammaproteobacteria bacterium RIFCSPHIGHO2_12_FULL_41_15]